MKLLLILGLCASAEAMNEINSEDNQQIEKKFLQKYQELSQKHNNTVAYNYQLRLLLQKLIENPSEVKALDLENLDRRMFDASQMWHMDTIEKLISENLELKKYIKTLREKPATQSRKTQVQNIEKDEEAMRLHKTLIITPRKTKAFEAALGEKKLKERKALSRKKPTAPQYFDQEAGSSSSNSRYSFGSSDFEEELVRNADQEILDEWNKKSKSIEFLSKKSNNHLSQISESEDNDSKYDREYDREERPLQPKYQVQKPPVAPKKPASVRPAFSKAPRFPEVKPKAVPGVGQYEIAGSFGKKTGNNPTGPKAPRFPEMKTQNNPGPGSYKIPGSFDKKPKSTGKNIWK